GVIAGRVSQASRTGVLDQSGGGDGQRVRLSIGETIPLRGHEVVGCPRKEQRIDLRLPLRQIKGTEPVAQRVIQQVFQRLLRIKRVLVDVGEVVAGIDDRV